MLEKLKNDKYYLLVAIDQPIPSDNEGNTTSSQEKIF